MTATNIISLYDRWQALATAACPISCHPGIPTHSAKVTAGIAFKHLTTAIRVYHGIPSYWHGENETVNHTLAMLSNGHFTADRDK